MIKDVSTVFMGIDSFDFLSVYVVTDIDAFVDDENGFDYGMNPRSKNGNIVTGSQMR